MVKQIIDIELIKKYLSGKANPEEALLIGDWISEDSSRWGDILAIEAKLPTPTSKQRIKKIKSEVRNKLFTSTTYKREFSTYYKLAATISGIILLTSSILYYLLLSQDLDWNVEQAGKLVKNITLPDQSKLVINRGGSIRWNDEFNGAKREVILHGDAFFDVSPDTQKPFIIYLEDLKIQVLGTAFNIANDSVENEIIVSVTHGKVLMMSSNDQLQVDSSFRGVYNKITNKFRLESTFDQNDLAYATQSIIFSGASFEEVAKQLSKAYGVVCIYNKKNFKNCQLTTEWSNKSLTFVLDVISEALDVEYLLEDERVYFYGNGCQ